MHGFPALLSGSSVMRSKWSMLKKYLKVGGRSNFGCGRGCLGLDPVTVGATWVLFLCALPFLEAQGQRDKRPVLAGQIPTSFYGPRMTSEVVIMESRDYIPMRVNIWRG